ncbi:class I SAM-dependent methyltransferase [Pseudoruegeria sp. SHC-113]|uniref:class I SAM-dependent methyltransferase n=1 Tax=Pseudoruegeria sp. SHC-113 TaxID=2855439 RepID=UPI0021BB0C0D|nr:class I SAM-dependent methyltransferase [Pseudoruegeria sp. SHC-113]MCT8160516.1 class I SAM-dependent methyltransferase [Pseudoruegeria sp. SHC-113]
MALSSHDAWSAGQSYEHYMGRWSRRIANRFMEWVDPAPGLAWCEIGCGTGALTQALIAHAAPRELLVVDPSADFLAHTEALNAGQGRRFEVADALSLPAGKGCNDWVVSGLVLNFVPDRAAALAEAFRVLRPGGCFGFYVWDYPSGGIGFIDAFWKAAAALDPAAKDLDEARRFSFCTPVDLKSLCVEAGFDDIKSRVIEVSTVFPNFEAFWHPFTLGAGPAPGYCASLQAEQRSALKDLLRERMGGEGPVSLPARAIALKAVKP